MNPELVSTNGYVWFVQMITFLGYIATAFLIGVLIKSVVEKCREK